MGVNQSIDAKGEVRKVTHEDRDALLDLVYRRMLDYGHNKTAAESARCAASYALAEADDNIVTLRQRGSWPCSIRYGERT